MGVKVSRKNALIRHFPFPVFLRNVLTLKMTFALFTSFHITCQYCVQENERISRYKPFSYFSSRTKEEEDVSSLSLYIQNRLA